jgi:hypothetical protein
MAEIAEKNFNIDTLRLMDNDSNKNKEDRQTADPQMKRSMKENQYRFCGKSTGHFANDVKVPTGSTRRVRFSFPFRRCCIICRSLFRLR